jgi:hypothetical protein
MKYVNALSRLAAAALLAGLSAAAVAAGPLDPAPGAAISAVNGGLNEEERAKVAAQFPEHRLELLFAGKGTPNEYLADIKVQIKDQNGKLVLDTVCDGPFLQVKMPAGRYQIIADSEGVLKQQTVQVLSAKAQRVVFIW